MKPTDIWTNANWWKPKQPCKNGMPCHEPAPRGSKTGTQGLKNRFERGRIPGDVFHELFRQQAQFDPTSMGDSSPSAPLSLTTADSLAA